MKLRPHQEQGESEIRSSFREFKCVLFVGPTGVGKTNLFCSIAKQAAVKGSRIIIIAHRQELINQISQTLSDWGVDHGIINPQFTPDYRKLVQVASVQTLLSRLKNKIPEQYRKFNLVIQDECHHLVEANTFGKVYGLLGRPRILGVTATPERADGKGLGVSAGGVFETMIEVICVRELMDQGFLSRAKVFAPPSGIDLSEIKTKMGDYDKQALAAQIDKPHILGDAVAHYQRICPGVPAIAFGISIEHCEHIAAQFREAGFNFQVIDGTMDSAKRKSLIKGLGREIQGLVSADLISEGTDIPGVTAAIFLRPTQSLGLYIQQAGRALRTVFGAGYDLSTQEGRLAAIANGPKPNAFIIDHVGNTLRHGLIDMPREWSLEGRKKKGGKKKDQDEEKIELKQCDKCFTVHAPAPICPHCGYVYPPSASRGVEQIDGQLMEITEAMQAKIKQDQRSAQSAAKSVEDMMQQLGYSRGRAEAIVKARAEKVELSTSLLFDLREWRTKTGQDLEVEFGIKYLADLKQYKPKALRELREKFDAHRSIYTDGRTAPLLGELFSQPADQLAAF